MRTLHNHVLTGTGSVYGGFLILAGIEWGQQQHCYVYFVIYRLLFSVPRRSAVAIPVFQRKKRFAFALLIELEIDGVFRSEP
jgi:hypothetical protein